MSLRSSSFLLVIVSIATFLALPGMALADAGSVIPMGDLEQWTVFSLGGSKATDQLGNGTSISGELGVAGNGKVTLSGNAIVNGNLCYRSNGKLSMAPGATVTGGIYNDEDSLLDNDVNFARAAANAALLPPTDPTNNISLNKSNNMSLTGSSGQTVVLDLKSFKMNGSSLLTLTGAADTTFIINVSSQFSLSANARIVLSGGLTWNDVVFNARGVGPKVRLSGDSQFQGMLLATQRAVQIRQNALVSGSVIADSVSLQGTAQLLHPPVVSP